MAKKIQLQDANGNVLHPLTLGECVTMSNGENLDTLMSKSQMFTPTITQDKSMFKVGTGIEVDYSANVKDGAYESLMFKGKSLVNLASEKTKSFTTSHFLRCTLSHELVNGKKYLLKWDITNNTIGAFDVRFLRTSDGVRSGAFTLNVPKVVTVTNDGFDAIEFFTNASSISQGLTATIDNIMVVEYVEGMENNISYFEGLCDVKMPILRNVGKNLLCTQDYSPKGTITNVEVTQNTLKATAEGVWHGFEYILQLKPNTEYAFSFERDSDTTRGYIRHPENKGWTGGYGGSSNYTFTTRSTGVIRFTIESSLANNTIVVRNPMIIEGSLRPISYEDYKTNILRTSEEIVLREVNGVQDTYNALTGEYVQRIGEIVLDGSENEWEDWSETSFVLRGNYFSDAVEHTATTAPRLKCNNMVAGEGETPRTVRYYRSPTVLWTMVGKNNGETLDQFKTWLSQNPTTIQYILAEPVTTIVKPSTMTPFAYQNGHVIVESGFEGQSLLPEIEYSVVTGRTGQVTQNTKVLRKQEQQIIGLEELLLTQVVQMEYERTLLQFDYELQMMMLG